MIIDIRELYKGRGDVFMCKPLERLRGKSAEYILDTYGNKYRYPVDIVKIVKNIKDVYLGSMDFSVLEKGDNPDVKSERIIGAVGVFNDKVQIIYSNKLNDENGKDYPCLTDQQKQEKLKRRQRFTIAHELAHCCLHINPNEKGYHIEYRRDTSDCTDNKEYVANIFAGELLMPLNILTAFMNAPGTYDLLGSNGKISLSKLADAFAVNNHVMASRIRHLRTADNLYNNVHFDVDGISGVEDLA